MTFQLNKKFTFLICLMSLVVAQFSTFAPVAYAGCKDDVRAEIRSKKAAIRENVAEIKSTNTLISQNKGHIFKLNEEIGKINDEIKEQKEIKTDEARKRLNELRATRQGIAEIRERVRARIKALKDSRNRLRARVETFRQEIAQLKVQKANCTN